MHREKSKRQAGHSVAQLEASTDSFCPITCASATLTPVEIIRDRDPDKLMADAERSRLASDWAQRGNQRNDRKRHNRHAGGPRPLARDLHEDRRTAKPTSP